MTDNKEALQALDKIEQSTLSSKKYIKEIETIRKALEENERLRKALEDIIHRPPVVCNKCWSCGDELAKQALGVEDDCS